MNKKKIVASLSLFAFLFLFFPTNVDAALVHINKDGGVVVNVLGAEATDALGIPKKESLQIKQIADTNASGFSQVSLAQVNGKISLSVATPEGQKSMDVTGYKSSLVEIEERNQANKVQIGLLDGKFSVSENGVTAVTDFPINVDPKNAAITVSAPSGIRYLAVLPFEAYQNLVKARIISTIGDEKLTISEGDKGELSYVIPGQKMINVFNLFSYPVDVKTTVSASTGEVLSIDEPIWLKVLGFAFI